MKCSIPEIAWHNREPVLSLNLQPATGSSLPANVCRLASGGADSHVLIWYLKTDDADTVSIEIAADLMRHQRAVNVVRWSRNGELLASGDDESIIVIWKQKTEVDPPCLDQTSDQDKETWLQHKVLRGHLEDVYDISWCPYNNFLISGSIDNTAVIWDIHKGKSVGVLSDHKGFVQGVSWDPKNRHIVTMSSDRIFRVFDINTKKVIARNSKSTLPIPTSHPLHGQVFKLFHDDTLQSYFRRLDYSPDGDLIAVPTGLIENEQNGSVQHINVVFIYKRSQMKNPICMLQCGESPSLVVAWNPVRFNLRKDGPKPLIAFPHSMRLILAVATRTSVLIYDTQQTTPLAIISNIHYARLTDLTWSSNGQILIVSSTDGYCSIIRFSSDELGEAIEKDNISSLSNITNINGIDKTIDAMSLKKENVSTFVTKEIDNSVVFFNKTPDKIFKQCKENVSKLNSPLQKKKNTTKRDEVVRESNMEKNIAIIDEVAMEPWSQDGMVSCHENSPPVSNEIVIDEPTEDIKIVFEESETCNNKEEQSKSLLKKSDTSAQIVSNKASPNVSSKTPRRVTEVVEDLLYREVEWLS